MKGVVVRVDEVRNQVLVEFDDGTRRWRNPEDLTNLTRTFCPVCGSEDIKHDRPTEGENECRYCGHIHDNEGKTV